MIPTAYLNELVKHQQVFPTPQQLVPFILNQLCTPIGAIGYCTSLHRTQYTNRQIVEITQHGGSDRLGVV